MASDIIERWKASALSTALTIYPCQIRVHQRWQSKLPTSYSSEEGVAAGHSGQFTPMRLPVNTVIHTTLVGLEPATFRSLVDCWSDALTVVPTTHRIEVTEMSPRWHETARVVPTASRAQPVLLMTSEWHWIDTNTTQSDIIGNMWSLRGLSTGVVKMNNVVTFRWSWRPASGYL